MVDEILTGVFAISPVEGLEYQTQSQSGLTNAKGEFKYIKGETVTFSIGGLVLGSAVPQPVITPAHIVMEINGNIKKLKNWKVTNLARFLLSIDKGGNIEEKILIDEETRKACSRYIYKIDFEVEEEPFTNDVNLKNLLAELQVAKLYTGPQARNFLRRTLFGIKKMADVAIPMRDGVKLYSDILIPTCGEKVPAILCVGPMGKCFHDGSICDEKSLLEHEQTEDNWFEGNPPYAFWGGGPMPWEKGEGANATDWVPRGYAIVRIDSRCIGNSEGKQQMFSSSEGNDFYDAVEWCAKQPWCDGNIGAWGTGIYGGTQVTVASKQPPHLKAIIPITPDIDPYRDFVYIGGLYMGFNMVMKNTCREWEGVEWVEEAHKNPFFSEERYGFEGDIVSKTDVSKVNIPMLLIMPTSGTLHTRGSSDAFIEASTQNKQMTIISEIQTHYWAWEKSFVEEHIAFMDYWLKGKKDNGVDKKAKVRMVVRTGRKGWYWKEAADWPVPGTEYQKLYLNCSPSDYSGDNKRNDFMKLQSEIPGEEKSAAYDGGFEWKHNENAMAGVSFITGPMKEDTLLAGYIKLSTWVSSTTKDMELHASVRVMDGENQVPYPVAMGEMTSDKMFPVSFGCLKVSRRKTDPAKCTEYRPYHTHLEKDAQYLNSGEVVPVEVEIWPTVAEIKKGYRLRLDIQPVSGDYMSFQICDIVDRSYQKGSTNTIYTGPDHPSFLQIPVIPKK